MSQGVWRTGYTWENLSLLRASVSPSQKWEERGCGGCCEGSVNRLAEPPLVRLRTRGDRLSWENTQKSLAEAQASPLRTSWAPAGCLRPAALQ